MNKLVILMTCLILAACKAEKVEISISSETVVAAAEGKASEIEFEATVGERFTKVDDEKRALIEAVKSLIQKYFIGADVDVDIGANEYEIEVEGRLFVSKERPTEGAPWHVSAKPATDGPGISVSLEPTVSFGRFEADLQNVNILLAPDMFQPVEFTLTAPSGIVLVGGAIVDGKPVGVARIKMNGQSIKMLFKEGVWEETAGTFVYIP